MPIAVSYARFSAKGRQAEGDSVRRQVAAAQAWCEENGYTLAEGFEDLGRSAFKGHHRSKGQLGRLLTLIDENRFPGDVLIVEGFDRLSREEPLEALDQFRAIINKGITVVTTMTRMRYSRESIRREPFQLNIILNALQIAHAESVQKRERIGRAAMRAKEVARLTGKPVKGRHPAWLDVLFEGKQPVGYRPNDHVVTIQRIFDLAEEGYGCLRIARILNEEDRPTLPNTQGRASQWYAGYASKLLGWRALIGEWQPCKVLEDGRLVEDGNPVAGHYPAVIEPAQFLRVQAARRTKPIPSGPKGSKVANLFTGLAQCAHCGGAMHRTTGIKKSTGRDCSVYFCISRGNCTSSGVLNAPKVEAAILKGVREWELAPVLDRRTTSDDPVAVLDGEIAKTMIESERLETERRNLIAMIAKTGADDLLADEVVKLAQRVKGAKALLADLEAQRAARAHEQNRAPRIQADMRAMIDGMDTSADRAALRTRLATALREVIEYVRMDVEAKTFEVALKGGARAYRFGRIGNQRQPFVMTASVSPILDWPEENFVPHDMRGIKAGHEETLEVVRRVKARL